MAAVYGKLGTKGDRMNRVNVISCLRYVFERLRVDLVTILQVITMGNISEKKMRNYYRKFEQIYENPLMTVHAIAENAKIARNTVLSLLFFDLPYPELIR